MTFALGLVIGFLAGVPASLLILWALLHTRIPEDSACDWDDLNDWHSEKD